MGNLQSCDMGASNEKHYKNDVTFL